MFWDRFYTLCIEKETKPNTIAREIGVSNAICTKWKKTGVIPNGETLEKIADCLDCSVDYLLGRTENPTAHVKSNDENNQLIDLLAQLTPAEQEMISAQIKGLLEAKKNSLPKDSEQG